VYGTGDVVPEPSGICHSGGKMNYVLVTIYCDFSKHNVYGTGNVVLEHSGICHSGGKMNYVLMTIYCDFSKHNITNTILWT